MISVAARSTDQAENQGPAAARSRPGAATRTPSEKLMLTSVVKSAASEPKTRAAWAGSSETVEQAAITMRWSADAQKDGHGRQKLSAARNNETFSSIVGSNISAMPTRRPARSVRRKRHAVDQHQNAQAEARADGRFNA